MKLVVDMNLSPRWVEHPREAGFDTAHWSSIGAADAPDVAIMDYARATGSIVLPHDLDFSAILAATHGEKPSVIQIRASDVAPHAVGPSVITALRQMASELAEGALITIDLNRTRLRILPLER